ncbi:hypothetical protein B0J18DRAFT_491819 [Chaetomium sp. MPI-SDFR-AT-0129]|nr:hypothetical protein B0J18DRAFT_491819 [Chaetomium sp. MPI-SDFR-AT-0129]
MNPSATPHTPLERLLLFRGITQYGLEDADFARLSDELKNNGLVKHGSTYDAGRLAPDALRDLFLRLLREELKAESERLERIERSEKIPGAEGASSPASKKRKLQSPPPLTLKDARRHIKDIETAHAKLYNAYMIHTIEEVREFEEQFIQVQGEIGQLEKLGVRESQAASRSQSPNGISGPAKQEAARATNGTGPSPGASPRPPQAAVAQPGPQQPLRPLQPLQPQSAAPQARPETKGVPASSQPTASPEKPSPALPDAVRSPRPSQPRVPTSRPVSGQPAQQPPNGAPQVLQAPQGAPPFQPPAGVSESLQRPDSGAGPRPPTGVSANGQPHPEGQLKWEPPYQPTGPSLQGNALPAPPPGSRPQPPPGPTQAQAQVGRPLPPQHVLIPPQAAGQLNAPLQSPTGRPPADSTAGPRPPHTPGPAPPHAHPQYAGHPVPATGTGPATPAHPKTQVRPPPVPPGPVRSPAVGPSSTGPPAGTPKPSPSPNLAAPQPPSVLQPPSQDQQRVPPRIGPSPASVPAIRDVAQRYNPPHQPQAQGPRPAAMDRIHPRLPAASTPTPAARFSPALSAPQTPAMTIPPKLARGSGTKWVSGSTPSTPQLGAEFRLGYEDVPSPAFEPPSPIMRHLPPPVTSPSGPSKQKPGRPNAPHKTQGASTSQPGARAAASQPSTARAKPAAPEAETPKVKHEVTTPRPLADTEDTTADESVPARPHHNPSRAPKRKREELTPTPGHTPRASQHLRNDSLPSDLLTSTPAPVASPPKLVLWTRSFNKVCGSAMEQIVHHRSANMFAAPIRERDAPGYHKVVKQAQDLKSIRAAISHGNRAAHAAHSAAAASNPSSDNNNTTDGGGGSSSSSASTGSSVWLPRTEDLVPPRSIINSSQLDRELAHMFSNAIMYNPDPHHGPGPAFVRDEDEDEEVDTIGGGSGAGGGAGAGDGGGVLGYKVDEFGVVNDARAMFVEVEKLLSELRSAEVRRGGPPAGSSGTVGGGGGTGTSTRQASVLGGNAGAGGETGKEEDEDGGEGEDGEEGVGGVVKRRRLARG